MDGNYPKSGEIQIGIQFSVISESASESASLTDRSYSSPLVWFIFTANVCHTQNEFSFE